MAITLCLVRGLLVTSDGDLLVNSDVQFTPVPPAVRGQGEATILPKAVMTTTDVDARLMIGLTAGRYNVTAFVDGKPQTTFSIDVPPLPSAEIEAIRVGREAITILSGGGAADTAETILFGGAA